MLYPEDGPTEIDQKVSSCLKSTQRTVKSHLLPCIFRGLLCDVPVVKFYITPELIILHSIRTGHFTYSTAFSSGKERHAWRRAMLLTKQPFACIHKLRAALQEFESVSRVLNSQADVGRSGLVWCGVV
jgi:hypothetical protein